MENFGIYCKTYNKDIRSFERLLASYKKFNRDGIKFFVSVPKADFELFRKFDGGNVKVITDESFAGQYFETEKHSGYSTGYINQQICKLAFFETGFLENYFCVDSDAQFIRDFYKKDFSEKEIQDQKIYLYL